MWIEPLTASARDNGEFEFIVTVSAGDGLAVAAVRCPHSARAGFGYFGEMAVLDPGGGARQTIRALVLLVREALRYASEIGIMRVRTDVPPRLQAFAAQISGVEPRADRGARTGVVAGELHEIRSHALTVSDAGGVTVPDAAAPVAPVAREAD